MPTSTPPSSTSASTKSRDAIANGTWTPESIQKVMDKLEAAELVADCPKDKAQVDEVLKGLEDIESLLKKPSR